jgi:putative ABC transport system substrate-binding protein
MGDAVADGFATSFAHPGGNVTGGSALGPEASAKRLALAMEMLPSLRRAVLMFDVNGSPASAVNEFRTLAQGVGVTLQVIGVRNLDEIESGLKTMKTNRPQALFLLGSPMMYVHGFRVIAGSASYKVPVITDGKEFAQAGALFTYNADYHEMWGRSALYVDRILKGAKAGDLPIEQPSKFEMIINLRTVAQHRAAGDTQQRRYACCCVPLSAGV